MRMAALAACLFVCGAGCRVPIGPIQSDEAGDAGDGIADLAPADLRGAGRSGDLAGDDAVRVDSPGDLAPDTPRLTVIIADVGQGDGAVARLPGGKVLVVDGGPYADRFEAALTALGISQVDYIVLSHAHADHYTGLSAAIARLPGDCERRVFDPGLDRADTSGYVRTRGAAGCRYQPVAAGQTLNLDPQVEATVMAAHDQRFAVNDDSHGINNSSVVLRLRYGRFSMLFEGDAEAPAEQDTLQQMGAALRSTVLKVGHHGSCTASARSYLAAVSPQFATLSMAAGNSYGHPHCQTISKLHGQGLHWGRTDSNGAITVTSDSQRYAVAFDRGAQDAIDCPRNCASPLDF